MANPRRKKQKVRVLQDATGAKYTHCLSELNRRSAALKDGTLSLQDHAAWWRRVDDLPDPTPDTVRCPRCLELSHEGACG